MRFQKNLSSIYSSSLLKLIIPVALLFFIGHAGAYAFGLLVRYGDFSVLGAGDGQIDKIHCISIEGNNLYVADKDNDRMRVLNIITGVLVFPPFDTREGLYD